MIDWKTKGNFLRQWYHIKWWRKSLCRSFEWEKMASRMIFGLFLSCELFSVSCRLRLQIYELFNELSSQSGTYKRRIIMAKTMKKLDSNLQKQEQGWPKLSTQQENTRKMKIWKITTAKFKCTSEHILGHDWLTKVQNILQANFFMFILLISNHTVFLVQFGINLLLWVFQKAKLHSPKRLVQFQLFEKLTRAN